MSTDTPEKKSVTAKGIAETDLLMARRDGLVLEIEGSMDTYQYLCYSSPEIWLCAIEEDDGPTNTVHEDHVLRMLETFEPSVQLITESDSLFEYDEPA